MLSIHCHHQGELFDASWGWQSSCEPSSAITVKPATAGSLCADNALTLATDIVWHVVAVSKRSEVGGAPTTCSGTSNLTMKQRMEVPRCCGSIKVLAGPQDELLHSRYGHIADATGTCSVMQRPALHWVTLLPGR
jgi:hypothetical protein